MYSFTVIHESRNLKQARPFGQYVDLLRFSTLATPSWVFTPLKISSLTIFVNHFLCFENILFIFFKFSCLENLSLGKNISINVSHHLFTISIRPLPECRYRFSLILQGISFLHKNHQHQFSIPH